VTYLDLKSLGLPVFDEDIEEEGGMPEGGAKLVQAISDADALVIGNPEYNGGITGALKNAIDWASRADQNPFAGKVILLMGTSSGQWGSVKSHMVTRGILTHLKGIVTPSQITIPNNTESFDDNGNLKNPMHSKFLQEACTELVQFAGPFRRNVVV